jgi:hypothetical protein
MSTAVPVRSVMDGSGPPAGVNTRTTPQYRSGTWCTRARRTRHSVSRWPWRGGHMGLCGTSAACDQHGGKRARDVFIPHRVAHGRHSNPDLAVSVFGWIVTAFASRHPETRWTEWTSAERSSELPAPYKSPGRTLDLLYQALFWPTRALNVTFGAMACYLPASNHFPRCPDPQKLGQLIC